MSGYQQFPVALFKSGQDQSVDPWLIPEDAMQVIENGYQYRGIIYSRDGYSWFDQMPYAVSTTAMDNPYQNIASINNAIGATVTTVGDHGLTNGTIIRLVNVQGLSTQPPDPALNGSLWTIGNVTPTTFTINNVALLLGVYTVDTGTVCYFPSLPIVFSVSNATTTTSAEITTSTVNDLQTGDIVIINGILGIEPQDGQLPINGVEWPVTVIDNTHFTINNTVAFTGSYTSGGTVTEIVTNPIVLVTTYIQAQTGVYGVPQLIVCDIRRAAYYDPTQMALIPIGNADQFSGGVLNQFWAENYFGKLFITNGKDNIFWWNNDPSQQTGGLTALVPQLGPGFSGDTIDTCLMIKAVANRLNLFNVTVSGNQLQTQVYWCRNGADPTAGYTGGPSSTTNPWDQITPGQGYGVRATDSLYLISMAQVQYNLMVWSRGQSQGVLYQYRVTSDPVNVFQFVKISDTRNVDSTFGSVALDRQITGVGSTGLITSDGNSVGRYDDKIPDFSLTNIDQDFVGASYAMRFDPLYQSWLLYTESGQEQNNKVAVFNYQDLAWYFYDISLVVLGLYNWQGQDAQWNSFGPSSLLGDPAWEDFTDETWSSYSNQQNSPMLLGGDYNGIIWRMNDPNTNGNDGFNNSVYQAPEVIGNPINFDLTSRQWAPFIKEGKSAQFGYFDVLIPSDPDNIYTVNFYVDDDPTPYLTKTFNALPNETDYIANITNISQHNPAVVTSPGNGLITGQTIWIYGTVGMTEINNIGYTITVIDQNTFSLNGIDSTAYTAYVSGGAIYTSGIADTLFWRRVWCGQQGTFHTLEFTSNALNQYVEIHGLILGLKSTGRIFR